MSRSALEKTFRAELPRGTPDRSMALLVEVVPDPSQLTIQSTLLYLFSNDY